MKTLLKRFGMVLTIIFLTSCAARVITVNSDSDVVRIGKGVVGQAYLWNASTKEWQSVKDFHYPEGWFSGAYHPK